MSLFLLFFFCIPLASHARPPPRGFLLNCGSTSLVSLGDLKYTPDDGFISVGNKTTLKQQNLLPILLSLRVFPDKSARKYCFNFPVSKNSKYLIRTTYYYGNFDGNNEPPVFDQIIDGTKWSVVNTTEDYSKGLSSYYEIIVAAAQKTLSVCLARNEKTVTFPFISALEVEFLEDSMYNSTDLKKYALNVVARSSFGDEGEMISYPDDQYNRLWQPFSDPNHPKVSSRSSINPSDFWNIPPAKAFVSGFTTSRGKPVELLWPPFQLPATKYYVALYFQDNRNRSPFSWRVFDVAINGISFYSKLNVSSNGLMVYSGEWPLSGQTRITLTPAKDAPVGPVIQAGEVFQVVPFGGRTNTRDVTAMDELSRNLDNLPADWSGDPCLPQGNPWTGVSCSQGPISRVLSVNVTSRGLTGSLPPSISKMTALKDLWMGKNKLTGSIPDLSSMKQLETLHLENNQLSGPIPQWLEQLPKLRELFLANNSFEGTIPRALLRKQGLNIQVSPGNMPGRRNNNKTDQTRVASN